MPAPIPLETPVTMATFPAKVFTRLRGHGFLPKSGEPVLEMRGTKNRIIARSEAPVVQRNVVIESTRIGYHFPGIACRLQVLTDEFVLTDWIGTRRFDYTVQRFRQCDLGQDGGNIIRDDRLHHGGR